jgi:hypothetical protein
LVGAFDYVFEISNGLMAVNQKNELEFPHRRTTSGLEIRKIRITCFEKNVGFNVDICGERVRV